MTQLSDRACRLTGAYSTGIEVTAQLREGNSLPLSIAESSIRIVFREADYPEWYPAPHPFPGVVRLLITESTECGNPPQTLRFVYICVRESSISIHGRNYGPRVDGDSAQIWLSSETVELLEKFPADPGGRSLHAGRGPFATDLSLYLTTEDLGQTSGTVRIWCSASLTTSRMTRRCRLPRM